MVIADDGTGMVGGNVFQDEAGAIIGFVGGETIALSKETTMLFDPENLLVRLSSRFSYGIAMLTRADGEVRVAFQLSDDFSSGEPRGTGMMDHAEALGIFQLGPRRCQCPSYMEKNGPPY